MNVNPLDRAPTLPPGIKPRTFPEMYEAVFERLMEAFPELEESTARGRAWQAVTHLIDQGYVQWWGMDDGLPSYVPVTSSRRTRQALVYIW